MVFKLKVHTSPVRAMYVRTIDAFAHGTLTCEEIALLLNRAVSGVRSDAALLYNYKRLYVIRWTDEDKPQPVFKLTIDPMPDAVHPRDDPKWLAERKKKWAKVSYDNRAKREKEFRAKRAKVQAAVKGTSLVKLPPNVKLRTLSTPPPVRPVKSNAEKRREEEAKRAAIVARGGLVK